MSELLRTLYLIRSLGSGPLSSAELQEGLGVSRATLNRHIAEARNMGAKVEAEQGKRAWLYTLANWSECQDTVTKWIALEEARKVA